MRRIDVFHPLERRNVLEPLAAVAFDPKALSIIDDAMQGAVFLGTVLRKSVPARWLCPISKFEHPQSCPFPEWSLRN
jgi:hypothetical protein